MAQAAKQIQWQDKNDHRPVERAQKKDQEVSNPVNEPGRRRLEEQDEKGETCEPGKIGELTEHFSSVRDEKHRGGQEGLDTIVNPKSGTTYQRSEQCVGDQAQGYVHPGQDGKWKYAGNVCQQ